MSYKIEEDLLVIILLWVNARYFGRLEISDLCDTDAPLATHNTHVEPSSDRSKAALRLKQEEQKRLG